MTEQDYDRLWNFVKEHRDEKSPNPNEPQTVYLFKLFQANNTPPINIQTADDMEEACLCVRMALMYA